MPDRYQKIYEYLVNDNSLKRRLVGAIIDVRGLIYAEPAGTTLHANRVTWANSVFTVQQAQAMAERMMLDVLADNVVFANPDFNGDNNPDGKLLQLLNANPAGLLFQATKLTAYSGG